MAINAFDSNGYMLKVNLFASECSDYQNLQSLKEKLKTGPGLLRALRRDPRPAPAGHHAAGPDVHRRAGGRTSASRPPREEEGARARA